jgi:DNA topoisomerase-2
MIRSGGALPDELPYMPWWNKFTGTVVQDASSSEKYVVRGTYETDGACVRISELPVGTWSSPYKAFLEELVSQGKIAGFEWPVDDERVAIRVDFIQPVEELTGIDAVTQALEFEANPSAATAAAKRKAMSAPTEDVEKLFKLATKVSTSNVHLYTSGKNSHIKKYTVRDIYADFYAARLAGYVKRKEFILSRMEHDHRVARARIVFIEAKLSGTLVLENRPDEAVQADLAALGLPLAHELGLKAASGYDYLLDMKLRSLTRTKVEALRADVLELETNIARVRATPV